MVRGKTHQEYATYFICSYPTFKHNSDSEPVTPKDLNIVVGDEVISRIELPKESEVKNFSLGSIKKDKAGFEIKVDWGGGFFITRSNSISGANRTISIFIESAK